LPSTEPIGARAKALERNASLARATRIVGLTHPALILTERVVEVGYDGAACTSYAIAMELPDDVLTISIVSDFLAGRVMQTLARR